MQLTSLQKNTVHQLKLLFNKKRYYEAHTLEIEEGELVDIEFRESLLLTNVAFLSNSPTNSVVPLTYVDSSVMFSVTQSTEGVALTLPNPTETSLERYILLLNEGTVPFSVNNVQVPVSFQAEFYWSPTTLVWSPVTVHAGESLNLRKNLNLVGVVLMQTTLTSTTLLVGNSTLVYPCTLVLTSTAGTRKIELSASGVNFFIPEYDLDIPSELVVSLATPVTSIRVTGSPGDVFAVVNSN